MREYIQITNDNLMYHKSDGTVIKLLPTIEDIMSADNVDRPQGWIPCSERLPNIGEKVLASTKKTVFTQVFKGYYSDPKRWAWENNRVKEIEAWQPLPKPWKGADDD